MLELLPCLFDDAKVQKNSDMCKLSGEFFTQELALSCAPFSD
jgi:hypothetical protein